MRTTQYLYGINPSELENKMYFEALQYKHEAGKKLFKDLYYTKNRDEKQEIRYHYVIKAINHTKDLLEERTEI